MCEILDATTPYMPPDAPRYLMGVGLPLDLVEGVARGVDMFDCVIQTRHARSGIFYTSSGRIRMTDSRYRSDLYPPDPTCDCYTCRNHSRAYLNHLFRINDILSATLTTIHNLHWFASFMNKMRTSIVEGNFDSFRQWVHNIYPSAEQRANQNKQNAKSAKTRKKKRRK